MKEKQACPPYSSSNIDVVNADQVGAAAYSLSHSYMTASSDVCITTYLVIDAAPSVHTMSADFMIFPADGITSRNVTITDAGSYGGTGAISVPTMVWFSIIIDVLTLVDAGRRSTVLITPTL